MMSLNKSVVPVILPVLAAVVAVILSACSRSFLSASEHSFEAAEEGWTKAGVGEVVNAGNEFAFDLFRKLACENGKNLFFSPYSLSVALAMTYEGAEAETAEEISDVFHFPPKEILRPNSARIHNQINRKGRPYELRTGNALWVERNFELKADYIEAVRRYYGGKAVALDFINQPEQSRERINHFIAERTNYRIDELLPKGIPDRLTRLILTNAIYFMGDWKYQFDKDETAEMPFYRTPEDAVDVSMMFMDPEKRFSYADLDEVLLLEMPYREEELSMLIILPKNGVKELELTAAKLDYYRGEMEETLLDGIYFPRFKMETEYELGRHLRDLGMPIAFTENADFSGMHEDEDLFISDVFHKAYVEVDEQGTEAAAATGLVIRTTAVQPRKIFKADRPFIFLVQEKETGLILFMGQFRGCPERG